MQLRPGDPETIGGYTLQERLGSGGMGTVFLAYTPSGRPVAIKLIHQQFLDDDEFRTRFRQEVAAARRVSGAFTAAVVDADPAGAHPWMATTYIQGPTLAQRITEGGALGGAELRTLAIGLVEALRDIHRAGVVHRDLKPSNVVLSPDGPRVIDFGISRATDHQTLTMTGRVIGTPPFMSPEQLQAPREVGPESDVFSLATLLVYAATGQGPFDADSPYMTAYQVVHEAPVLSRVPAPLRGAIEPCLAKDRAGRPSADELLEQLRALPEELTVSPSAAAAAAARDAEPDTRLFSPQTRERLRKARVEGGEGTEHAEGLPTVAQRFAESLAADHAVEFLTDDRTQFHSGDQVDFSSGDQAGFHSGDQAGVRSGNQDDFGTSGPGEFPAGDPAAGSLSGSPAADDTHPGRGADSHPGHGAPVAGHGSAGAHAPGANRGTPAPGAHPHSNGGRRSAHRAARGRRRPAPAPFSARGLRSRWRTVVAVATAVAAISTGVALLSGGPDRARAARADGTGHDTLAVAQVPPPAGFKPWRRTVTGGLGITDELRCVAHGDSVYCGGGGVLGVRLRTADGTQVWKRASPGVPAQGVHMVGFADGTMIGYRFTSGGEEQVVGLSGADGEEMWSASPSGVSAVFTGHPQDAVTLGSRVFFADRAATRIEAREARSGSRSWATSFPAGQQCMPFTAGDRLYAMCAPRAEVSTVEVVHPSFRTVDPETGALGRPVPVAGKVQPVGAAGGSLVLLREHRSGGGYDGFTDVLRLDPDTGEVSSAPLRGAMGVTPGLAGGTLYLAGAAGLVKAVDPVTGSQKWSTQTSVESASGPVLSQGMLYFSSPTGRVLALDARDGRQLWSTVPRSDTVTSETAASARVAVAGGVLVVTAGGNIVFGFASARPPKAF